MSQAPAPPSERNPFEVLGLQGTEELPAIRKAFLLIAASTHPDRLRMKSPEEKAQALEMFLVAKKAFEALSPPDKRREWSERMLRAAPGPARTPPPVSAPPVSPPPGSPPAMGPAFTPPPGLPTAAAPGAPAPTSGPRPAVSESGARATPSPETAALQLYRMGMSALEAQDYAKALGLFSRAAKLMPIPRHQAMELVCRGQQYLSTRFFDRARESFEQALRLLPSCREAQVSLELLEKQVSRYHRGR
ncbi:DnaJ domain-containing protein [Archangium primigenium]|uniref:DnaJ domain-containing protein n=1 Tax=[Archangium] primigenium TaxID=2792470 RepID=UPI00195D96F0|nr:DnaJ domain-containing protein [Archangium primigenium]MBM7112107.1 DnaJ domain-containing protein [Archangium primigenium]